MKDLARIVGLDVARALALLGMFAAHVGDMGVGDGEGLVILHVTHGRSAALFAVLAGVSMMLMLTARGTRTPTVLEVRHTRIRIAVRAALLIMLGWCLSALATPVDVILDNLGVMMLMALVALRWRAWILGTVGAVVLAGGMWVVPLVRDSIAAPLVGTPLVDELWSYHYPALSWVGYVLIGMAIGRWAPWRGRALGQLALGGLVVAVATMALAEAGKYAEWASLEPHSYSPTEMFHNVGVAASVMALCLWAAPRASLVLWPLAATGTMTLTLYTAHIVAIWIVGEEIVWEPTNVALLVMCICAIAFASIWRALVGQGPLERVFTGASSRIADALAPPAPQSPSPSPSPAGT